MILLSQTFQKICGWILPSIVFWRHLKANLTQQQHLRSILKDAHFKTFRNLHLLLLILLLLVSTKFWREKVSNNFGRKIATLLIVLKPQKIIFVKNSNLYSCIKQLSKWSCKEYFSSPLQHADGSARRKLLNVCVFTSKDVHIFGQ